ncbi:MAG: EamA family transporter, partial [Lysobacteraceae bacterium]
PGPLVGVRAPCPFYATSPAWTAAGAAIIFGANAYIAHREARVASRAVTDREISPETQQR